MASISYNANTLAFNKSKPKVVLIMGATGLGKSRLSIDLMIRFPGEIINSNKMQVYKGLNIATNKIPHEEQLGVPHHMLGKVDSLSHGELTPTEFRTRASQLTTEITKRAKVPYIVGGSNSFLYAFLAENYSPGADLLARSNHVSTELRYECCFLWMDVSLPVLEEYLNKRVNDMCESGMVDELAAYYESDVHNSVPIVGLMKCIGVPEFEGYLTKMLHCDNLEKDGVYKEAIKAVKDNTCNLANKQISKIKLLNRAGWGLHKLDATHAFKAILERSKSWTLVRESDVVEPSVKLLEHFLDN